VAFYECDSGWFEPVKSRSRPPFPPHADGRDAAAKTAPDKAVSGARTIYVLDDGKPSHSSFNSIWSTVGCCVSTRWEARRCGGTDSIFGGFRGNLDRLATESESIAAVFLAETRSIETFADVCQRYGFGPGRRRRPESRKEGILVV
jgi:hypothetical protein